MATADAGLGSELRPGLGGTGLELAVGSEGQGWRRSVAVMEAVRQLEAMMREPAAVLDSMKDKLSLEDLEILIAYFAQQGRDMWQALEVYDWMVRGNRVERRTRRLIHVIMDQRLGQLLQEGCPTEKVLRLVGRMVDLGLPPDFPLKRMVGEELWDRGAVAAVVKLLRMFRNEEESARKEQEVVAGVRVVAWNEEDDDEDEDEEEEDEEEEGEEEDEEGEDWEESEEGSVWDGSNESEGENKSGDEVEIGSGQKYGEARSSDCATPGRESRSRDAEAERDGDGEVAARVADAVGEEEEAMRAAEEREDLVGLLLLRAVSAGQYRQVLPLPRILREAGVEVGVAGFSAVLTGAVKEQEKLSVARRELRDLQQMGVVGQLSPLDGLLLEVHGATLRHEAEQVVQWCAEECDADLQRLRAAVGERERQREKRLAEIREEGRGGYEVKGREAQLHQHVAEDGEGSSRLGAQRLEALGCPLDEWAYALMVGGALKGGHVDVAAFAVREMVRRGMQPNAQQLALVLRRLQRGDAGVEAYLGLCAALADVGLLEPTLVFLYVDLLRLCILRML
ncbi:unnamed protein product [Closterium sp. Yama58-4]|nr:unnamed protein product [Closterium sp. Yama58-4]